HIWISRIRSLWKPTDQCSMNRKNFRSWSRGASIRWHSDDNRPYLIQRHFAVVCYLNNYGKDFNGGLYPFQDGQPMSIMPMAGDVLMYTADQRNIHSVDEFFTILNICCIIFSAEDGVSSAVTNLEQLNLNKDDEGNEQEEDIYNSERGFGTDAVALAEEI
ncbi:hypothetical protein S83_048498, partial [Arachis hypogaea]